MPCKIVFDLPTLNDAISKAARIAPTKGPDFDIAGGLYMEIYTGNPSKMIVRASDRVIFYEQEVPAISGTGDPESVWRVPSRLFADVVASLPMSEESTVTLIDRGDEAIRLVCDTVTVKFFRLDPESFPRPDGHTFSGLQTAHDFASKVEQVSWSCDSSSDKLSGVYVDGKRLVGTSPASMAIVPCVVPVAEPVIVPLATIAGLLKQASDLKVEASERKFYMTLDAETKASSVLIEGDYPKVDHVARMNFAGKVEINRASIADRLDRLMNLIRQDRQPRMTVSINNSGLLKQMVFDVDVPGIGRMQDKMEIDTEYEDDYEFMMIPSNLHKAVANSRSDSITLNFGHPDPAKHNRCSIMVEDKTGYQCWVMPLNPTKGRTK